MHNKKSPKFVQIVEAKVPKLSMPRVSHRQVEFDGDADVLQRCNLNEAITVTLRKSVRLTVGYYCI